MSVKDAAIKYAPHIWGYVNDDRVVRVVKHGNRTRIFIRQNVEWYGRPAHKVIVNGTVEDIKAEFTKLLKPWTDLGLSFRHAYYAWMRGVDVQKHLVEVPAGKVIKALKVTGTYFGSGSYVAAWRSNAKEQIDGKDVDTGFAVEEMTSITLQPGEYVIQYEDASPGSSCKRLYICK